jgi:hypothetical protein
MDQNLITQLTIRRPIPSAVSVAGYPLPLAATTITAITAITTTATA